MFGLYRISTGVLLSVGSTVVEPLPEDMATLELPEGGVYGVTHVWQESPPAWVSRGAITRNVMTPGDFMRRLGFVRETLVNYVHRAATTSDADKATLDTLKAWLARVSHVDVTDPITIQGVGILAQILDGANALPEGAQAFTATMLAPVTVE